MYTITITEVLRQQIVEGNTEQFDVHVEIKEGDAIVETKRFGFPLEYTAEMIKDEVLKAFESWKKEQETKSQELERGKVDEQAQSTITELKGKTL